MLWDNSRLTVETEIVEFIAFVWDDHCTFWAPITSYRHLEVSLLTYLFRHMLEWLTMWQRDVVSHMEPKAEMAGSSSQVGLLTARDTADFTFSETSFSTSSVCFSALSHLFCGTWRTSAKAPGSLLAACWGSPNLYLYHPVNHSSASAPETLVRLY